MENDWSPDWALVAVEVAAPLCDNADTQAVIAGQLSDCSLFVGNDTSSCRAFLKFEFQGYILKYFV